MSRVLRQLARIAVSALAIMLVLTTTFGVHLHSDHVDEGHDHHALGLHDHDHHHDELAHDDGEEPTPTGADDTDGLTLHSHGSSMLADAATIPVTTLVQTVGVPVLHPLFALRVPTGLARDIDPPPNKHAL